MSWNDIAIVPGQIWPNERVFFRDTAEVVRDIFDPVQITIVNIGIWRGASMHCCRVGAPDAR